MARRESLPNGKILERDRFVFSVYIYEKCQIVCVEIILGAERNGGDKRHFTVLECVGNVKTCRVPVKLDRNIEISVNAYCGGKVFVCDIRIIKAFSHAVAVGESYGALRFGIGKVAVEVEARSGRGVCDVGPVEVKAYSHALGAESLYFAAYRVFRVGFYFKTVNIAAPVCLAALAAV